jgi:vacuolar-type H+-ATPase subunit I/STV1
MHSKIDKRKYFHSGVLVSLIFALLISCLICGCGKKDGKLSKSVKSERVSWQEITIKYPSYQKQMEKLKAYNEEIQKLKGNDELLKDMLQDASYNCITEYLENVSKTDKSSLSQNAKQLIEYIQEIHSLSPDESLDFVENASQAKNVDLLCVALSAVRTERAQSEAARKLGSMKDPVVVRPLVSRLSAIAFFMIGGSEGRAIRRESRAAFVEAISECTGLEFLDYDPGSEEDTLVVIKWIENWLEENNL